ncbi:MAG: TonB-dependent receptor [Pseudohongiellaceae bacterium]
MQSGVPATPEIEEISVIGQFVPDEKRTTSAVSNVVNQLQFERTGDSDMAESLKRVAGLSTVDGKFVYVRGLGERYSNTLLNGAMLPSPEPVNRVVPMDLFPTAILDSVLVQKTWSAQFPSEFGGGVLQLRTKKSTDEFFWNVSSSVAMEPATSFRDGFSSSGGGSDWLGFDDGSREIPTELKLATANGQELRRESQFLGSGGYSAEELQVIGQSLDNNYELDKKTLPADYSLSTSLGNFHDIGDGEMQINYLGAVDYSNSWDTNKIERNSWKTSAAELEQRDDLDYTGTENSIDISGIFTAGLDISANHNVRFTSVLLRQSDNTVSETVGDLAAENKVRLNEIEWIERALFSNQIQGDHYIPGLNEMVVNWRYSHLKAERDSPDHRRYRYDLTSTDYEFSTRADGNVRRFSVLDDTADEFGVDVSMVFHGPWNAVITPQLGYVYAEKDRQSEIRRYSFFDQGALAFDRDLLRLSLEEILLPENIGPEGFELREFTRPTDNYVAGNELKAYYLQTEINFNDRFRFTLGARQEDFRQAVSTFDLFRSDVQVKAEQRDKDWLPVATATYIHYDHQFRLAYSETLSRPDFRELSPAAFTNPVTGKEVIGNPDLQIASIKNFDFRWEWYFSFSDYMALGLFYKQFDKPIESVTLPGADNTGSFINAGDGENKGIEYEVFKRLGFLPGIGEDFYFQGNIAFIDSTVSIREDDRGLLTTTDRPLQGQSDWLLNAQFGYEPVSGTTATLLYHYYGERIAELGTSGNPDLIEQPFGELNFILLREINDHWEFSFKAKNLLDQFSEITQSGNIVTRYSKGREYSVNISYVF